MRLTSFWLASAMGILFPLTAFAQAVATQASSVPAVPGTGGAAPAAASCPVSEPQSLSLPHSAAALAENRELLVVAIGSSSTESLMSSNAAHSYPGQLQRDLSLALPNAHVAVVNRGIAGQDAAEELPRLGADVVASRPQLVIWQVGANGALRKSDPTTFETLVVAGIERLKSANEDVILMDNQRSPAILGTNQGSAFDAALADAAKKSGVNLFSRGALMDQWAKEGFSYARFVSPDGLHHNDLGYRCVAQALSDSIAAGIRTTAAKMQTVAKTER